jgi:hypothetical protein
MTTLWQSRKWLSDGRLEGKYRVFFEFKAMKRGSKHQFWTKAERLLHNPA